MILAIYLLALGWAAVMWRTNKDALVRFSFEKALLFGFSSSKQVYELENEVDEHFQVAIGFLIITVSWTYELQD
jgi:hypothetical protein